MKKGKVVHSHKGQTNASHRGKHHHHKHHKRKKPSLWVRWKRFWKKAKRILAYAKPYWKIVSVLLVITGVLSLLSLAGPYLVKILLDVIIPQKNTALLIQLMSLFILIFVVKTLVGIWHSYQTTKLVENMILDVKTELFNHLENLDLSFYHTTKVGDILYRLDEDVYSIDSFIDILVDDFLLNLMTAVFILIICLRLSWKVTVISLTFFPFYVMAQQYFGNILEKQKKKLVMKVADLISFLEENLAGIKAIKSFALETKKLNDYTSRSKDLIIRDLKMDLTESFSSAVVGIITFIPLLIILWYGGYSVINGALTVGSLIAIYTYIGKLFGPVSALGSLNVAIKMTMVSVNRVFEFMDVKSKLIEKKNAKPLQNVKGDITFKNVSFGYYKDDPVLKDISFHMKPGQMFGLVGPSGSGKSTIGNLVFRFFDPKKGTVSIDGHNLRDLTIRSIRQHIGIVSQEAILFNTTIKENIKLGNPHAKDAEVVHAATLANIHDRVMSLPKGYNTVVGERGETLSGGEKQRLSIARVILKNPPIIILDEATSSLDSESEQKIQEALQHVTKGRTTLVIAHRLSTIRHADKILVLGKNKFIEKGNFDQLMKKKGLFYHLYTTQFGQETGIPQDQDQPEQPTQESPQESSQGPYQELPEQPEGPEEPES